MSLFHFTSRRIHGVFLLNSNKICVKNIAFAAFNRNTGGRAKNNAWMMYQGSRSLTTQEITKNIHLHSDEPRDVTTDHRTLRLVKPIDKPLAVLFMWLAVKQKHLLKFAQIYNDCGFDVVTVQITPWQLLWPTKGTQLVASDVIRFLYNNTAFNPILLHGFSVGAYLWGECLVKLATDEKKYQSLLDRICGQVWDSAADVTEIPVGVPKALFPRNPTLQAALNKYMMYHMKAFHETATSHYIRSSQMFHSTIVRKPALFLLSKTDPVGTYAANSRVRECMEANGIHVDWKCWDKSPHVQHFLKHREEYTQSLFEFLASLKVLKQHEKMRAKL
uniref:Putative lethal 2 k09913 isoform c n=1 Tax=Nyssomyia neivai TaxID=330878 RepID=A0A1L8DC40_9DIPT